jgi:hypothetical protein
MNEQTKTFSNASHQIKEKSSQFSVLLDCQIETTNTPSVKLTGRKYVKEYYYLSKYLFAICVMHKKDKDQKEKKRLGCSGPYFWICSFYNRVRQTAAQQLVH